MDPRRKLLRNGWITLFAALTIVGVLSLLQSRASAADMEPPVAYCSIGPITWLS